MALVMRRREGRLLQDAFTALRHHTHLDQAGLLLAANSQRHVKPEKQMRELFADLPQVVDNTQRVVDRIDFTLENLGYEFPCYAVPEGHDQASFLREQTFTGARDRYGTLTPKIVHQLEHELRLITKLKLLRLLSHHLGHRPLRPQSWHPGAGPWQRGQQRRVLQPWHYQC